MTIVLSSLTAIIETVPLYYRSQEQLWSVFEIFIVAVFTLEFVIRCYAHTSTPAQFLKFLRSFYTWVDVVAILPFYLSRLVINRQSWSDMQRFTVLRLFRLLRLFRCYTFSSLLQLSIDALIMSLRKSVDALLALMVFITFIMIAFSTLIYFAERGEWDPTRRAFIDVTGEPSQFFSIPASLWFVAEIITTVGLGDIHPKTSLGKAIAMPLMMISLLIIALPSIVIGRNFAESWAWLRSTRPFRPVLLTSTAAPASASAPLVAPVPIVATIGGGGGVAIPPPPSGPAPPSSTTSLSPGLLHPLSPPPPPPTITATSTSGVMGGVSRGNGPVNNDNNNIISSANLDTSTSGPLGRETRFLADLSTTQLPVELPHPTVRFPLPAPSADVGEHGEVILGILQELQRQNDLLERLVVTRSAYAVPQHSIDEQQSAGEPGDFSS